MNSKFFGVIKLDDTIPESGLIDIEMLRTGDFEHKAYGTISITDTMLQNMIDNFYSNVVGREISFDWNHKAEEASAWLKEVRNENGILIGSVEFTDNGKDSVSKKEFGYFSIEYADNYEDSENGSEYGPTILGGALTNRPFITNLKKIEFSMDNVDSSLYKLREDKKMPVKIEREPVKKDEEKVLTLEEIQAKNEELNKRIMELEDKKPITPEPKDESVKFQEFIVAQTKQLESMTKKLDDLENRNKELEDKSNKSSERARVIEIERACDNLLTLEGHHPAVVGVAKDIMLNADASKIIKFSETIGEGTDAKTIVHGQSVQEAVIRILEAIPASQRANYTVKTTNNDGSAILEEEDLKAQETGINKAFAKRGMKRLTVAK